MTMEDFVQTIYLYQNRRKVWSWVEVYELTGLTPTQFQMKLAQLKYVIPDPLWSMTQSGKNLQPHAVDTMLALYTEPDFFRIGANEYGVGTHWVLQTTQPYWAHLMMDTTKVWRVYDFFRLSHLLYAIPSVRKIFLVGSTVLQIDTPTSDVDIAIQAWPQMVLVSRLWVKLILKLTNHDAHSFWLGSLRFGARVLRVSRFDVWLADAIGKRKQSLHLKVDCGLIYTNWGHVESHFGSELRQIWLRQRVQVPRSEEEILNISKGNIAWDSHKQSFYSKVLASMIWCSFWLTLPLFWPLSLLQILWFQIREKKNPNRCLNHNFVAFFPKYHLEEYIQPFT